MLVLGAALSLVVGLLLGMLGGGGAILTLPMLVYVMHVDSKDAIASSLLVVGATSLVGMLSHARAGAVRWKTGLIFSAGAMSGAYAGGSAAKYVPGALLLVAFGVVMVVTATLMLLGRRDESQKKPANVGVLLMLGAMVGVLSGLVGAGGGFMVVPALTLFGGLVMREAIGTSLFVISLQSAAGFMGHIQHARLDSRLLLVVIGFAIAGSLLGTLVSKRIPAALLRKGFAWFVVAMGMFMFFKQLPLPIAAAASVVTLIAATMATRRQAMRQTTLMATSITAPTSSTPSATRP